MYIRRAWGRVLFRDQTSLLCGAPSGNTINVIHNNQEAKQLGSKWRLDWFSYRTSHNLELGLDLNSGISHIIFSGRPEYQMHIWGHPRPLWISLNPKGLGGALLTYHSWFSRSGIHAGFWGLVYLTPAKPGGAPWPPSFVNPPFFWQWKVVCQNEVMSDG